MLLHGGSSRPHLPVSMPTRCRAPGASPMISARSPMLHRCHLIARGRRRRASPKNSLGFRSSRGRSSGGLSRQLSSMARLTCGRAISFACSRRRSQPRRSSVGKMLRSAVQVGTSASDSSKLVVRPSKWQNAAANSYRPSAPLPGAPQASFGRAGGRHTVAVGNADPAVNRPHI